MKRRAMPTIMCTKDLWKGLRGQGELPQRTHVDNDPGRLGDWCAKPVRFRGRTFALAINERTYLTTVFRIGRSFDFVTELSCAAAAELSFLGLPSPIIEAEVRAIAEHSRFSKTDGRSLLGSLNELAHQFVWHAEEFDSLDDIPLPEVQHRLNPNPHVNRDPCRPWDAVLVLFGANRT